MLRPGDEMLDIGCGWGTLAMHAAKNFGAKSTGITISKNQTAFGNDRIAKAGLSDRARIECLDYRDIPQQQFDRISSLEMVEHVGVKNLSKYCKLVYDLLKDDGIFLLQLVGLRRGGAQGMPVIGLRPEDLIWGLFMSKYIFPGADASHAAERHEQGAREGRLRDPERREHQHPLLGDHSPLAPELAEAPRRRRSRRTASAGTASGTSSSAGRGASAAQGTAQGFQVVAHKNLDCFDRKLLHPPVGRGRSSVRQGARPRSRARPLPSNGNGTAHAE